MSEFNHLDLANRAPMPDVAYRAMLDYLDDLHRHGGDKDAWKARIEKCRSSVATLLRADKNDIAFMRSTSDGLNAVAQSIDWARGGNVVVARAEHPNNLFPWLHLRNKGVEIREIDVTERPLEASDYFALMDSDTRVVAASLVGYNTGQRLPIEQIATRCHELGALMVVDAVQAVGLIDVDVGRMGIDALACGSQKGLLSGYGVGLLYINPHMLEKLTPAYAARASLAQPPLIDGQVNFARDARRFEIGNPNYAGLFSVHAVIGLLLETGIAEIEARVRVLVDLLLDEARRAGFHPAIPLSRQQRAGIVVLAHDRPAQAVAMLREQRILVTANEYGVRASPHLYNDEDDLVAFVRALKSL